MVGYFFGRILVLFLNYVSTCCGMFLERIHSDSEKRFEFFLIL